MLNHQRVAIKDPCERHQACHRSCFYRSVPSDGAGHVADGDPHQFHPPIRFGIPHQYFFWPVNLSNKFQGFLEWKGSSFSRLMNKFLVIFRIVKWAFIWNNREVWGNSGIYLQLFFKWINKSYFYFKNYSIGLAVKKNWSLRQISEIFL